ncbi:branched-chain amino acid ABC transporter permease [Pseudorhodoferax sp.]|uniref:branched-chain amino acid ABC transporter permease n=1 Tax=Pseudorhodoferax sp. TaxID=1993553 RepID=UPI002DD671EB|nr:branched-chain amino acid ABC transporter permease [Pseudorhodoferax sp.]
MHAPRPVATAPLAVTRYGPWLLLVFAIASLFLLRGYHLLLATNITAFAIAILGLNLLSGYNGQISLGHGAFLALGGYATAILMARFGVPFWLAVPLAGLVSMGLGLLIAIPALRLEMLYLALATFSLAIAVPQLAKNKLVSAWTGGVQGLEVPKPAPWTALGFDADQTVYAYALVVAAICFAAVLNLLRGRMGRALEAIRDQPLAADTMGVDTRFVKTACFGLSAFLTGLAGGLGAVASHFVSPDGYTFFLSITLLVGAVIGGFRSVWGALFGGAFIVLMPNYAEELAKGAPWVVYGLATIVFMAVMPNGFAGLFNSVTARIANAVSGWSRSPARTSTRAAPHVRPNP